MHPREKGSKPMTFHGRSWRRLRVGITKRLMVLFLFALSAPLASCQSWCERQTHQVHSPPSPPSATPAPPVAMSSALTLNLAECIQLALERQPRVAAQRASLAAAADSKRAVETLRCPAGLHPQIPVRCRQAALGVAAAAAGLERAEREAVYAVTRLYFTVL